jgi:hypothetical protein
MWGEALWHGGKAGRKYMKIKRSRVRFPAPGQSKNTCPVSLKCSLNVQVSLMNLSNASLGPFFQCSCLQCDLTFCEKSAQFCTNIAKMEPYYMPIFCPKKLCNCQKWVNFKTKSSQNLELLWLNFGLFWKKCAQNGEISPNLVTLLLCLSVKPHFLHLTLTIMPTNVKSFEGGCDTTVGPGLVVPKKKLFRRLSVKSCHLKKVF